MLNRLKKRDPKTTVKNVEHMQLAELDIRIIRSKRKSISLQIKQSQIILRSPQLTPRVILKAFALSKIDWLRKHQQKQKPSITREYEDGEVWHLFGETLSLKTNSGKQSNTHFNADKDELCITIGSRVKNTQQFIQQKLTAWYKKIAINYLENRVSELAQEMQLDYKSIAVRDYKARWGSCSSQGHLSFNWRIFMAPKSVIDSVIVHELAHLKHFNHSKQFWQLVYTNCPDYKNQHDWLKQNQHLLQA